MRVVVALSGGVDSSVAAALLKSQGYEVIGIHLLLYNQGVVCCGAVDGGMAKRVAARLGIPFYVVDLRNEFEKLVVEKFCMEYAQGRTPNPCIWCNEHIKFPILQIKAQELDAKYIATGHYARIKIGAEGIYQLLRGVEYKKDQSYFLYTLNQAQLSSLLLPIGEYTKQQIRRIAGELGLPSFSVAESQEICFISGCHYARFINERHPELFVPGPIYDVTGKQVGIHSGIINFTVGQRKGLRIALGKRQYVVKIDARENAIYIGSEDNVFQTQVWAKNCRWVRGEPPLGKIRVWAKLRSQSSGGWAEILPFSDDGVYVKFAEPQWAPTPGQAVVFWNDEEVIGGGIIERSEK